MAQEEFVLLASRVNYPVKVTYKGVDFMLAPKQKTKREFVKSELGPIKPTEVMVVR